MNTQHKRADIHVVPEPDWHAARSKARALLFAQQEACRLVCSNHWASEGFWIEFPPYKALDTSDIIVAEKLGI